MSRPRKSKPSAEPVRQQPLVRQLRIVALVAVLGGALAGLLAAWEQLFPIPEDKLVKVYFTHSCRCAHPWARTLETEGFVVRMFEPETLRPTRAALHTPANLRGCHVAEFMGYFIEGHVPPETLRKLAEERPPAHGIAMQSSLAPTTNGVITEADQGAVLIFQGDRDPAVWPKAIPPPPRIPPG